MIAVNQYGEKVSLPGRHPRKELMALFDATRAAKIYQDKKDGSTVHVGYIVRGMWWTLYTRWERKP
jgi:hypothetical protein